jgi:enamine deaminase RidA (YjgF/YER057c/UK114 family)
VARTLISTGSSFEQAGAYSRAVVDGDFCFVAGTTGYDYATMQMPGDIGEQTRNCFQTIEDVLSRAGFRLSDVVRAVYYVVAMTEAERVLAICAEHFRDIRPAGTIVEVRRLLKPEMRIEIEVTAKRSTP